MPGFGLLYISSATFAIFLSLSIRPSLWHTFQEILTASLCIMFMLQYFSRVSFLCLKKTFANVAVHSSSIAASSVATHVLIFVQLTLSFWSEDLNTWVRQPENVVYGDTVLSFRDFYDPYTFNYNSILQIPIPITPLSIKY